jgi:ketosteroid isomerase-like protein
MKKSGITAVLLLLMTIPAWADSDKEQLKTLLNEFLAGASANEVAAHERFWAEDLVYTSSSGLRFGKADILKGMNADPDSDSSEQDTVYSAEEVRIRIYGDTAVVAFRLLGNPGAVDGKVMQYFNTGTFVKRDGEWKAVAWQATIIPDPD